MRVQIPSGPQVVWWQNWGFNAGIPQYYFGLNLLDTKKASATMKSYLRGVPKHPKNRAPVNGAFSFLRPPL